jgi:hypothetical protein
MPVSIHKKRGKSPVSIHKKRGKSTGFYSMKLLLTSNAKDEYAPADTTKP